MSAKRTNIFLPVPSTTRGQAVRLGADNKGEKIVYANGRSIYVRDLANPTLAWEYTGHNAATTVARFSPSGYYCASGDVNGNVRIWDTINNEHILKTEVKPFSGRINDLAWDFESKRIVAVGEGKDKFGAAFLFDSGSSVGEILGHSKVINACSIRPSRPFRAVTASDDSTVNFYHGAPYKFNHSLNDHSRFVQDVRYSPNGDHFVSAGMDGKIFLYDGKEGKLIGELSTATNTHTGGVYSIAWSPDSKHILTSSADMTAKLWDVAARSVVHTWTMSDSPTLDDQQVGNLWGPKHMLSLSLSGTFNFLDKSSPNPVKYVKGHQKAITAFSVVPETKTFYTGDYEGRVFTWSHDKGNAENVQGQGHTAQINDICVNAQQQKTLSVGLDDVVRESRIEDKTFTSSTVPTKGLPRSVAVCGNVSVVGTVKGLLVLKDGNLVKEISTPYEVNSVAFHPQGTELAVGGEDSKVRVFEFKPDNIDDVLTEVKELTNGKGAITAVRYSPNGALLAAADAGRMVTVYDAVARTVKLTQWCFHGARVTCLDWSPDSLHAASGSVDTNVFIWSVEAPRKNIEISNAHLDCVNGIAWLDNKTVATVGQDATIKTWEITHIA